MDLPADLIQGTSEEDAEDGLQVQVLSDPPKAGADDLKLFKISQLLKSAKAPLVVLGKGAAYSQAEASIREFIDTTQIPFLPTPMGKGVIADSHPLNTASARSTALREADVVLILGARLNWILHFGDAPKWNPSAKFIHVDISPEEIGKNAGDAELGLVGDISTVVPQLLKQFKGWHYDSSTSQYLSHLHASRDKNEATAAKAAANTSLPMTYSYALNLIKETIHSVSPPKDAGVVYISEGANTMDISRSIFPVDYPRLRLDAGTYATMGVGLGYAIAAHTAYNSPSMTDVEAVAGPPHSKGKQKKIVCLEGDSAFGFSAMEVETMARYGMDILIFVMNNGGVYHGDSDSSDAWLQLQQQTLQGHNNSSGGLRSTSLGYEVGYEKIAELCGGKGWLVRTGEELEKATREAFAYDKVSVVNVMIEPGKGKKVEFGWQASAGKAKKGKKSGAKL